MCDFYVELIDEMNCLIKNNLGEFGTVLDISKRVGYSPFHLSRVFRTLTGITLGRHLRKVKLKAAAQLLEETDLSIITISYDLGFSSQQAFTRFFPIITAYLRKSEGPRT